MTEKLQAIVLSLVRHNDRSVILNVYTPDRGRVPLLMTMGSGRAARMKAAQTMPLAQIEFSCNFQAARELQRPSGIAPLYTYRDLYFHPVKNAVGIFLAEFLNHLLRDSVPDPAVFGFIAESLRLYDVLDTHVADFHIVLLAQLATFMGIAPDTGTYAPGSVFDMRSGRYSGMLPGHPDILTGIEARLPLLLSRLNFANMSALRLSRHDRAALLAGLLRYWGLHYPGLNNLKSPGVLAQLFD